MSSLPQQGGGRMTVFDEVSLMSGHVLLIILVLISVYVSRIPIDILAYFRLVPVQLVGLVSILVITVCYGWVHGILGALALALVVSRAKKPVQQTTAEQMTNYIAEPMELPFNSTRMITEPHRWLSEKILNENPYLIQERSVSTSAVQDLSERTMGSQSSPSSR